MVRSVIAPRARTVTSLPWEFWRTGKITVLATFRPPREPGLAKFITGTAAIPRSLGQASRSPGPAAPTAVTLAATACTVGPGAKPGIGQPLGLPPWLLRAP